MPFEHKENSGSLFRNDNPQSENSPTHKGSAKIDGQDYWISAWINETKDGKKYFSIKFEQKHEFSPARNVGMSDVHDEDVPF